MKARIVKAHGEFKVGDQINPTVEQFEVLSNDGLAVTEGEWNAIQAKDAAEAKVVRAREVRVDTAINKAVDEGRIPPKSDTTTIKAHALVMEKAADGVGVEYILSLPVLHKQNLENRVVANNGVEPTPGLSVTASLEDCAQGVIKCTEPQNNLIKSGGWAKAYELAKEAAIIMKQRLVNPVIKGASDYLLRDLVKAATFTDPNSQVGSMAGDLIIMRNLGYLVYKLPWLKKLTTDMTGEPVKFGQTILTRYITPPGVLTWVPGLGFTSDTTAINAADPDGSNAGPQSGYTTQSSGTVTKSVPSTTDRSVALNMFKATEIEFPVSMLAGTVRNLFGEQLGAQTYSLAEEINKHVLTMIAAPAKTVFNGSSLAVAWGTGGVAGLTYSYTKPLANWNLSGLIGIKNKMTIAKIPDVGRFVLLHSFYHDKLLEDSNLLSAKAIMALIHKDEREFNTGELPTLFGLQVLESQLSSWSVGNGTTTGALTTWVDDTTLGSTDAVGFAGNMSSGIFVARPPQDFTTIATELGIPITASVRLMTEPDSGLTVMVFSYVDNGKMSINQRVCLMYGASQGDPRIGVTIKAA